MRWPRWVGDLQALARTWFWPREYITRSALGTALSQRGPGRLRLGFPHFRGRASRALYRRIQRREQERPAAGVLPPRWRHPKRDFEPRPHRLEPYLRDE